MKQSATKAMLDHFFKDPTIPTKDLVAKFNLKKSTINWAINNDPRYVTGSRRSSNGKNKRYDPATKQKAIDMHNKGASYVEIGKTFGCSGNTITYWCDRDAKNRNDKFVKKATIPEVEEMRGQMFAKLQDKYLELELVIEESTAQLHSIHNKMEVLGEQWD